VLRSFFNDLQNPAKNKVINCDAALKSLFGGRDKVGMLEIPKLLNPHFMKN
jgi:chromatin remodeling complex protein RSC6